MDFTTAGQTFRRSSAPLGALRGREHSLNVPAKTSASPRASAPATARSGSHIPKVRDLEKTCKSSPHDVRTVLFA